MTSQKCPNCALVNFATEETCKRCGIALHEPPVEAEETVYRQTSQPSVIQQQLGSCPDCNNLISHRAESCPHCGRFFQSFRQTEVIGKNWSWRIAWGVVLGYFGILIISAILFFTFGVMIAGMIAGSAPRTPSSSYR
jgi:RNA polymerase subunit RPABC4/transcription elongation factor Spt4